MLIYSLSGPSGTGKSTSALQFAYEHQIEAIIDDGLLIINGEKIAGTSAKFEKNTVTAVRRAIFEEDWHKEQVKQGLMNNPVQSLLIIGTSDKMTKKIAKRLEIGEINSFHYVTEIRSQREMDLARFVRTTQGKHVMPIPHKQVEQNFFSRLVHKGVDIFSSNREKLGETTIVRPDFQQETIQIARSVYVDIIVHTVENSPYVAKLDQLQFTMLAHTPKVSIVIHLKAPVTYDVVASMYDLQQRICEQFHQHFTIEPQHIHIQVKGIETKKRP